MELSSVSYDFDDPFQKSLHNARSSTSPMAFDSWLVAEVGRLLGSRYSSQSMEMKSTIQATDEQDTTIFDRLDLSPDSNRLTPHVEDTSNGITRWGLLSLWLANTIANRSIMKEFWISTSMIYPAGDG